ncbi:hypothetical protein FRC15_009329 [Serendipita sp. 397]|nr:hypothetical protein FRC15_009329 [Serendipita sp. 397]
MDLKKKCPATPAPQTTTIVDNTGAAAIAPPTYPKADIEHTTTAIAASTTPPLVAIAAVPIAAFVAVAIFAIVGPNTTADLATTVTLAPVSALKAADIAALAVTVVSPATAATAVLAVIVAPVIVATVEAHATVPIRACAVTPAASVTPGVLTAVDIAVDVAVTVDATDAPDIESNPPQIVDDATDAPIIAVLSTTSCDVAPAAIISTMGAAKKETASIVFPEDIGSYEAKSKNIKLLYT